MLNGIKAYASTDRSVDLDDKPRMLIRTLQGVLDKLGIVRSAIERKEFGVKYTELSKVTTIIEVLNSSLDMSQGEIPRNLAMLYTYLIKQLTLVHTTLDTDILDECRGIVQTLLDGFSTAYAAESKIKRQGTASGSIQPATPTDVFI